MDDKEIEAILEEIYVYRVGQPVIYAEVAAYGRGRIGYRMEMGKGRIKTGVFPSLKELMEYVKSEYCHDSH